MYSQNQEEAVIKKFFESPGGNLKTGTLLSIGENDGKTLSNALALIEGGWSAVLVEPSPAAFAKLIQLHKNNEWVVCYQLAIANTDGELEFHDSGTHLGKGDTGLLSSLKEDELTRFPGTTFEKIKVQAKTWETFYIELPDHSKKFEFISIDAEGMDLDILQQIDFNVTNTKLVCVEWNGKSRHLYDRVMYGYGFRIVHLNGENIIYGR